MLRSDEALASRVATTESDPADRIGVLDVLRGLAILIMIIAHVADHASAAPTGSFSSNVARWINWFVNSKGFTIFAILFGASSSIILTRVGSSIRFLRRLLGVAAVGFLTEGVFGYTVLFTYSVTAVPLLVVRKWSTRTLVLLMFASWGWLDVGQMAVGLYRWGVYGLTAANEAYDAPPPPPPQLSPADAASLAARRAAVRGTSFSEYARTHFRSFWQQVTRKPATDMSFLRIGTWPGTIRFFSFRIFALFLLGLLGMRLGVFQRPAEHRGLITAVAFYGLIYWSAWRLGWHIPTWTSNYIPHEVSKAMSGWLDGLSRNAPGDLLALTYIGIILLVVSYWPAWLHRRVWLAAAGQMALTTYVVHIAIVELMFRAWGFGWSTRFEYAPFVALLLFAALATASRAWLKRFRFGPAEWILRSITYWKWQPLRRQPTVA